MPVETQAMLDEWNANKTIYVNIHMYIHIHVISHIYDTCLQHILHTIKSLETVMRKYNFRRYSCAKIILLFGTIKPSQRNPLVISIHRYIRHSEK